jgi:hypothetical protein
MRSSESVFSSLLMLLSPLDAGDGQHLAIPL